MKVFEGTPGPLGLSFNGERANFALFSHCANQVTLGIFLPDEVQPEREISLYRTGDIWHVAIEELPEKAEYAFHCKGPPLPGKHPPPQPLSWLSDPYAKIPKTADTWGKKSNPKPRSHLLVPSPFDWEGTFSPKIPPQDLVIYEMHVRGFTRHRSSKVSHPGTYLGVIEKIPYLKKLGVNALELMPVFEFDETHCKMVHPKTKKPLVNYWGYQPLYYFAPQRRFSTAAHALSPIEEFKIMVRELHRNGIEVLLDVVYNHTGEDADTIVNLRGIDKRTYYMLDKDGHSKNYTGCGNTLNTNHPAVQALILDSLRYWVQEMGVDGFRFDLASILTRGTAGEVLENPPLLQAMAEDAVLKNVRLIAEAWDAAGLYQVGSFPKWGPWSEWNGVFRDAARRFLKGSDGQAGSFAAALTGSESLYGHAKTPFSSINFITAHDGFTLRDLVTYQQKHNEDNGEANRDGNNQNDNWNCGTEGPTKDPKISSLREMQIRNFLLTLFLSQGTPMLLMGDEYGHTRRGNNNSYVQDNELSWFLWDELEKNQKIFDFTAALIAFRKSHLSLRSTHFLTQEEIDWHGTIPLKPNWGSRFVAFTLKGEPPIYVAFNADFHPVEIALPEKIQWKEIVRTDKGWASHFLADPNAAPPLPPKTTLPSHSALVAKAAS